MVGRSVGILTGVTFLALVFKFFFGELLAIPVYILGTVNMLVNVVNEFMRSYSIVFALIPLFDGALTSIHYLLPHILRCNCQIHL